MRSLTLFLLSVMAGAVGAGHAGRIEGYLWPVVADVRIDLLSGPGEAVSRVVASLRKVRDCPLQEIHWHRVTAASSEVVLVVYGTGADVPPGPTVFRLGPAEIPIPSDEIIDHSFGEALHRCHRFWLTRTRLH